MEYCSRRSLCDQIKELVVRIPKSEVKLYVGNTISGLMYIHSKNIAYLDIKPTNILLMPVGYKDRFLAKIADFRLCKNLSTKMEESPYIRGTYRYMLLEIITHKILSYPANIWVLGCTIIEMLTTNLVLGDESINSFEGILKMQKSKRYSGPKILDYMLKKERDFLSKCFIWNPHERWIAEMLLQHPFLDFWCKCYFG